MLSRKLALLILDPQNIGRVCELFGRMPNIETSTLGGTVFWDTLASRAGWKVQKNFVTKHVRLLDPQNVRRAWGSERQMLQTLRQLT